MKQKYNFYDDYSEGTHPNILNALIETNLIQDTGYGNDTFSEQAKENIKRIIENKNADIHLVSGGTQANLICISAILKPYQSVIAPQTGYISVHKAGAIENTGHKINTIKTSNGKITTEQIQDSLYYLNDIPRKIINFQKPSVLYYTQLS